jgi:hypothetical protein
LLYWLQSTNTDAEGRQEGAPGTQFTQFTCFIGEKKKVQALTLRKR